MCECVCACVQYVCLSVYVYTHLHKKLASTLNPDRQQRQQTSFHSKPSFTTYLEIVKGIRTHQLDDSLISYCWDAPDWDTCQFRATSCKRDFLQPSVCDVTSPSTRWADRKTMKKIVMEQKTLLLETIQLFTQLSMCVCTCLTSRRNLIFMIHAIFITQLFTCQNMCALQIPA